MNLEAWQAGQKAQKDEERLRKDQAASALKNYRKDGLSEEEIKLAERREEERRKKLDAEQRLRGYRGSLSEEDAKLAQIREEERQRKLEAAQQNRGYGLLSGAGVPPAIDPATITKDDPSNVIQDGAVSSLAGTFKSEAIAENNVQPKSPSNPSSESPSNTTAAPPMNKDASVTFRYGLVSSTQSPELNGYLESIDAVVTTSLGEKTKLSMNFQYPRVLTMETDASYVDPQGRERMNRKVVTVSIPFTGPDDVTTQNIKKRVVQSVSSAIASGEIGPQE